MNEKKTKVLMFVLREYVAKEKWEKKGKILRKRTKTTSGIHLSKDFNL